MRRLSPSELSSLPSEVARPGYDLSGVRVGIVHLGVGAFHRAHQAVYVDDRLAHYGFGLHVRFPELFPTSSFLDVPRTKRFDLNHFANDGVKHDERNMEGSRRPPRVQGMREESRTMGLCFAPPHFRSYETIFTENGSVRRKRPSLTCPTPATFSAATIAAFR